MGKGQWMFPPPFPSFDGQGGDDVGLGWGIGILEDDFELGSIVGEEESAFLDVAASLLGVHLAKELRVFAKDLRHLGEGEDLVPLAGLLLLLDDDDDDGQLVASGLGPFPPSAADVNHTVNLLRESM